MPISSSDAADEMKTRPVSRRSIVTRVGTEAMAASRFAVVGAVATAVHMAVVWVLADTYGVMVFIANLIAFGSAFGFSFVGHHFWTFAGKASVRQSFSRFLLISIAGFLANSLLLVFVLKSGLLSPAASALVAVLSVPVLTFVASRVWGFRER